MSQPADGHNPGTGGDRESKSSHRPISSQKDKSSLKTPFARVVAVDTKEHTLDDAAFADAQSFMIETKANEETLRKLTEYIKTAEKSAESRGPEQEKYYESILLQTKRDLESQELKHELHLRQLRMQRDAEIKEIARNRWMTELEQRHNEEIERTREECVKELKATMNGKISIMDHWSAKFTQLTAKLEASKMENDIPETYARDEVIDGDNTKTVHDPTDAAKLQFRLPPVSSEPIQQGDSAGAAADTKSTTSSAIVSGSSVTHPMTPWGRASPSLNFLFGSHAAFVESTQANMVMSSSSPRYGQGADAQQHTPDINQARGGEDVPCGE